ncbi:hypothetical protein CYMTET_42917 [Cymbomonas tetramitiformis]|uniref:Uncharacterized protein n=1 Tax=Cymbomonas tetramitiformis TaxID=36881 RepID=A0AAE0C4C2_9CHLO|nr:hypothetical protein CYMTET_42917 [Cymbomonas tetramitiformis]
MSCGAGAVVGVGVVLRAVEWRAVCELGVWRCVLGMIHIVAAAHVASTSIAASAVRSSVPISDWVSGCSAWLMLASRAAAAVAAGRMAMRMTMHATMVALVGGEGRRTPARGESAPPLGVGRIAALMLVLTVASAGVVAGGTVGGSGVAPWRVEFAQIAGEVFVAGARSGLWIKRVCGGWDGRFGGFIAGVGLPILLAAKLCVLAAPVGRWHAWGLVVPRHDPLLQNWHAVSPVFSCHCVKERFSDRDVPAAKWAYGQR